MVRLTVLSLLAALPLSSSHMAITVLKGGSHECRSNSVVGDARREPGKDRCHGTSFSATTDLITLSAGEVVTATTTFGAGHNGGHTVWALSAGADESVFYKFQDDVDVTLTGGQSHTFTVPSNAPAACASTGCTLTWLWTPVSSGACEIYQNCFNVKILGASGGLENVAPALILSEQPPLIDPCARVDPVTHLTPMYAPPVSPPSQVPGSLPDGTDVSSDCVRYVVKEGDTLSAIASEFDVEGGFEAIYEANTSVLLNGPDQLEVGMVLEMPGGDCGATDGGDGKTTKGLGAGGKAAIAVVVLGLAAAGVVGGWRYTKGWSGGRPLAMPAVTRAASGKKVLKSAAKDTAMV